MILAYNLQPKKHMDIYIYSICMYGDIMGIYVDLLWGYELHNIIYCVFKNGYQMGVEFQIIQIGYDRILSMIL